MNMFDEARALSDMLKMRNMTQSEIAASLGVSQSYVANKIRLLRLPERVKTEILDMGLCERQARQLLRLDLEEDMLSAIKEISERKMTVAESEVVVDMLTESEAPKRLCGLERLRRISAFLEFLDSSLESLSSIGITTDKTSEIHNNKRYITILINES